MKLKLRISSKVNHCADTRIIDRGIGIETCGDAECDGLLMDESLKAGGEDHFQFTTLFLSFFISFEVSIRSRSMGYLQTESGSLA